MQGDTLTGKLRMFKPLKLVIFDAYGVVLSRGYPDTAEALHKRLGVSAKLAFTVMYTEYFNQAALRKISQKEAWSKSVEALRLPLSGSELRDLHFGLVRMNRRTLRFAEQLKKDYAILLLSKNTRSQFQWLLSSFPVLRRVFGKNILNTWEYGLPKAGKETVEFVCQRFKVKPAEILYIDDQKANLKVPRQMGIKTILYQTWNDFKKEIKNLV